MAALRSAKDGRTIVASSHLRIGRSHDAGLKLSTALVSQEHATLRWVGDAWEVKDLGSTNGTFVDGRRLEPGESARVDLGSKIAFGDVEETWEIVEADPPGILATAIDSPGLVVGGKEGLLVVPSEQEPELSVYRDGSGRWVAESGEGDLLEIADGAILDAGGRRWRISLPVLIEGTPLFDMSPTLDVCTLRFEVSRDEEQVRIVILFRGREIALDPQWHSYVLLTLARLRQSAGSSPIAERGWIDRDRLQKMLRMDANGLNVAIHKAREQMLAAGVQGAAAIVEVRRGQRRFGTDRFEVIRR